MMRSWLRLSSDPAEANRTPTRVDCFLSHAGSKSISNFLCESYLVMGLPSIEILEANHDFPGPYMFKVIGAADENFTARVIENVRDELKIDVDPPFTLRATAKGKHVAITLEPECESAQQVIAIYGRLTGLDGVVMMF